MGITAQFYRASARDYGKVVVMQAWVNDAGIRFKGLMGFQTSSPKGTFEGILDKLQARKLADDKRLQLISANDGVAYHTIPTVEAVKLLRASGIETYWADEPLSETIKAHLIKCEKAVQSAKPIIGKFEFPETLTKPCDADPMLAML